MQSSSYDSFEAFWRVAGPLYEADPVLHTTQVSVNASAALYQDAAPVLWAWQDHNTVLAAYMRTPPHHGLVSGVPPELAEQAVRELIARDRSLPGVQGPTDTVHAFAGAWCAWEGAGQRLRMHQLLYRLDTAVPPRRTVGQGGPVSEADLAWLAAAQRDFALESGATVHPAEPDVEALRAGLRAGRRAVVWRVAGEPVAYAFWREPVGTMTRLGPVYTEPAYRGRGVGSAVTAAATRAAQEAGATEILLFTDAANAVSNSIYEKLGYVQVRDMLMLDFVSDGET